MLRSRYNILIIGGNGLIGSALVEYFKNAGESLIYSTRRETHADCSSLFLNLEDRHASIRDIPPVKTAIVCACITQIEACERDKIKSRLVNVDNMFKVASALAERGTRIIYLSSNAVFSGRDEFPSHEDPVSPITEYGKQKAEAERLLMSKYQSSVTILRLTKVLGRTHPLFANWVRALRAGDSIHPFRDMYIAPIPLSFVVSVVRLVVDRKCIGILHLSGDTDYSYADIADMACQWLGADAGLVEPICARESSLGMNAVRTYKTALDTRRVACEFGVAPPPSCWTIRQVFDQIGRCTDLPLDVHSRIPGVH